MGLVKRIGNEITFARAAIRTLKKLTAIREQTPTNRLSLRR